MTKHEIKEESNADGLTFIQRIKKSISSLFSHGNEMEIIVESSTMDLSDEELEELRMLSVFSEHEIKVVNDVCCIYLLIRCYVCDSSCFPTMKSG